MTRTCPRCGAESDGMMIHHSPGCGVGASTTQTALVHSEGMRKNPEPDAVQMAIGMDIHLETLSGTRLSGEIRDVREDAVLIFQPHRGSVIWIRRDHIAMASNKAIWI